MARRSLRFLAAAVAALLLVPAAGPARIVGGHDAPEGVYDAVANINFVSFGCSGTLISAQWVLTAGHCGSVTGEATGSPLDWPASTYDVTLGTTSASGSGGDHYSVDRLEHPPQYLATSGYDVTLLHLSKPAAQAPIKIAGKGAESLWKPGTPETIVGFGAVNESGKSTDTMQEAQVPIVDDATCAHAYPNDPSSPVYPAYFEPTSQICAGYADGGTDTCQGDSGGPMFGHDALGHPKVVGSTSYGNGCAEPGYPGVYARVADTALREWIRSVVPDAIDDAVALPGLPGATPSPSPSPQPSPGPPSSSPAGHYAISVPAVARKKARRAGIAVNVTCPGACDVTLTVRVNRRARRKLHLHSAVVGRAALSVPPRVRGTAQLKLRSARRVVAYRGVRLTVRARFTSPGGEHPTAHARARLK
jgi:hypothetical protein